MKSSITDTPKEINISGQKISGKELYNVVNTASAHKDSCIKLYQDKEQKYTAIFSWQDRNKWKIDYPIQLHKIHKQRYVTHKQCLQLSEHIFNGNSLDDLKGFIDVPIRHFTLDEMLQFKKEDEMMLRGEDPDLHKPAPASSQQPEIPETSKNRILQNKTNKPSIILGDISVPKEESRVKSVPSVTTKKKSNTATSPIKQFKTSAEELKKEKEQPNTAKTPVKPTTKKATKPKSIRKKTDNTSLLNLGKVAKPKKDNIPSLVMGEQLGTDQKSTTTPTPSKVKTKPDTIKKNKPMNNDNSLFSI
ncbi:hypothetical protein [uncultured Aquimarina sp.]|uniref:hypothetical protein n=1 Tax=uncultured Aquimarina sp. TaxID=575652 RepID=UPI002634DBC2|nr:hypothetical protein [uncultured Aquimarina sp.]